MTAAPLVDFGAELKALRVGAGLSVKKLSALMNRVLADRTLGPSRANQIENGRKIVNAPPWEVVGAWVSVCASAARDQDRPMAVSTDPVYWRQKYRLLGDALARSASEAEGWPKRVGDVPPAADCFQPRQVAETLGAGKAGKAVATVVLSGLGGVGKTQLAAQLARQAWQAGEVDLLVWVAASSRAAIIAAYAAADAEVTGARDDDAERAAGRFMGWLEGSDRRWLVVLDDLVDAGEAAGWWPPSRHRGRVLVTTRRRDTALAGQGRRIVDIGVFDEVESGAYLGAVLAGKPHMADDVVGVAADLGHLPLALGQAAAYMLDRELPCSAYRRRFADRRGLLSELVPEPCSLPDQYRQTVAVTWSLSVEAANALTPAGVAKPLLELASVLDPTAIPAEVFTTAAAAGWLAATGTGSDLGQPPVTGDTVRDGLYCLRRLNLVTIDAGAVGVHRLLQRVVREHLPPHHLLAVVRAGADALMQVWPDIEHVPAVGQVLRANAYALTEHGSDGLWTASGGHAMPFPARGSLGDAGPAGAAAPAITASPRRHAENAQRQSDTHPVLFRVGTSLGEAGLVAAAVAHFRTLAATAGRRLGSDHPDTLAAGHDLARWTIDAGEPAVATAMLVSVLADQVRTLGAHHPATLATRHRLASARGWAGDPAGALEALRELLGDRLQLLGPGHRQTLETGHDVAFWQGYGGDVAGAALAFETVLADYVRYLGPDYPGTLTARSNLARWRGEADDAAGAAAAMAAVVDDRTRVLGPDHPKTLLARRSHARWCGQAGDAAGAVAALESLLDDQLRVLGPAHPYTVLARRSLARWRGEAGNPAAAAAAAATLEALLADQVRVQGPDHPSTLATRAQLARRRGEAGDAAGAATDLEALLNDRTRVLGADHPATRTTRDRLGYWRARADTTSVDRGEGP